MKKKGNLKKQTSVVFSYLLYIATLIAVKSFIPALFSNGVNSSRNPDTVPAKAGNHYFKNTGFPRIKYGAGLVKPGMTNWIRLMSSCIILFLLSLSLFPSSSLGADESLCARVKIEIRQELTLERQAFDAHMAINNGLTNITLENVDIVVRFSDKDGNSVLASSDPNNTDALFFIRVDTMEGISNIEGTGTVAPSSTADIHWLIIPAPGASNGLEQGALYFVGATLKYTIGGKENVTEVSPDYIYVKPMPELVLDYFLPNDVYGDDPFTPEVEPLIPFSLGVRVKNNGTGTAKSLKIDSAQPKIVDNDQGLLVNFTLTGSEVNGQSVTNSLLANFGDIKPNTSGTGRWFMTCTLSGKFVDFKATFSHSNELGGHLTSLIDAVNTHFLIRDVLVDLSGRDTIRDFLAKDGAVYKVYESGSVDTEVSDQSTSSTLSFKSQAGIDSTYTLSTPVTAGFMYVRLADPFSGQKILKEVIRSDGKRIKTDNAWLSTTRYRSDPWQYFFNLFDANTTSSYTVVFTDPAGVNHPPVLQFIPDKTGSEGTQLSFLVQASDPDGTMPVLSASALPALAGFTDQGGGTGAFNWTPAIGQAGRYEITFTASDGILKTSQRVVIVITGTGNNPPLVPSSPSPQDGASSIPVNASLGWTGGDPDPGDPVTYDVYLGTSNPPVVKVSGNQSARSYSTSMLTYGTTYYWKIVARDSHGAETAGPVWRFTTLFASNNLISTVAVNRPTYNPDETVAITSTLRNPNQTTSLQNLVARISISNSQGATLLTDEKQIQTILPGQTITTNTTWNTSKNLKGTYTVKLEVLDGAAIVSTATTSFQILGSSQTGVGLLGTITAQPHRAYPGEDETLDYSLTNNGNEDLLNLNVKVFIANQETQEIKQTLESTANLLMGATSNGNFVASTSDLTPGTYTATLEVSSASLTQARTLASTTFKVIQAVTLPFSDNFDSYPVSASPPAPWFELGEGQAIVTGTEFHSGQNAITIGGGPENSQSSFIGLGETYTDRIGYEVWAKVNSTASSAYIGFSEEILGIMPQFNAVYFNGTDGKVYFTSADKDHGFTVPLLDSFVTGVWHKVRVEIDFANLVADVFIDDVLVGGDLPVSPKDATWEQEGTHSFQLNKIGVTYALGEPFYFDDFSVFSFSGEHTITVTTGSGGMVTPSGSVTVDHGGSQTFTITPDIGQHILDVKVDGTSVGAVTAYTFTDVASDHTIEALFATNQYTITATAGLNGTIAPSGTVAVNYGGSQTFTITPIEGYRILDVKVNGASVGAVAVYTISNVTADHTIEALFAINQYTLTATAGPNGTITPLGPVTVDYNGSQTFNVTPNEGYHVADVKVDGVSVGAASVYTISNVTAGHTIEVSFAINQYTITTTAGVNGTISPSGAVTVDHGGSLTFTITPDAGWYILDVKVDGISVGVTTSYTFSSITSAHTIEASFGINQYTLIATAGVNGTISPSGAITVNYGESQVFAITPNAGYHVAEVKVDGVSVGSVTTYTFSSVASAHTIAASFAINQYTITATAGPNGTITPSGAVAVNYGGSQTFSMTPSAGYRISDVKVDGVSVGAVTAYTFMGAASDHVIEASFGLGLYGLDLPRTGQTTTYAIGDDGQYRAGVEWPTPRFKTNADTTVADQLTGLVWSRDAGTPAFGPCAGDAKTWQGALDYIGCLNANNYLGRNDWRLPNLNELESLTHAGEANTPAWLNSQGFTNVGTNYYWSSTTLVSAPNDAWAISLYQGDVAFGSKDASNYVWPVSGTTSGQALVWKTGQTTSYAASDDGALREGVALPDPRFTTNPNTTVTDNLTGLTWASDAGAPNYGSCTGGAKTWQGALDYIACLNANNYLGHNDWRLPNRKELRSLVHYGQGNVATWLNAQGFSNANPGEYWSSTTYAASLDIAWSVDMVSGEMVGNSKATPGYLLAVRAGTITQNVAPYIAPTGGGVYECNTPVILGGQISDFDGDLITYEWVEQGSILFSGQIETIPGGSPVNLPVQSISLSFGAHVITLRASDGVNPPVTSDLNIQIIDTTAPITTALPPGGTYNSVQSVTLTCSDGTGSGCDKIYYTTDGTTPTTSSPVYSSPINISTTRTLKFFAKDLAGNSEAVKSETYTITTGATTVTVQLKDSTGNPLSGGVVQYYSGGWQTFGTTDATGRATKDLLPGTYNFSMTYGFARQEKSQNIATNPTVVFQTTRVTIQLKDSAGALMDTGTVQYYSGGWRDIGSTTGGQVSKELLPASYNFSMTYGFARQEKSQNIGADPTVVFQTRRVLVQLKDSAGALIDTGTVQYYSGGWRDIGSTTGGQVIKELLPASYNFSMTYGFARQEKSQNIATNPTVVFQTISAIVQLKDSAGALMDTGTVQYYSGGWRDIGSTSGGQVSKELLPLTYNFSMTYGFARQEKSQNIATNPTVVFQTTRVTIQLKDSAGALIDTGTVQYYSGGWRDIGATSGGQVSKELLPASYNFSMTYGFARQEKSQNIAADPTVVFQTTRVTVQLKDSAGALMDTGTVQYYSGGWRDIGSTTGGQVSKELLPASYNFSMTYGFARQEKSQNIASDPTVVFQTTRVTVQLKDSTGALMNSGTVQYYSGGWRDIGSTSGGQAIKELLPASYNFSMTYGFARQEKSQNIASDPTVVFQTGQVHSDSNSCTHYYAGGWRVFTQDMELLPVTYTFRFNDTTQDTPYTIVIGTLNHIH